MICHSTVLTWCVKLGHGGDQEPAGRSTDLLFHSQAQIHNKSNSSGQKMQFSMTLICEPFWVGVILQSSTAGSVSLFQDRIEDPLFISCDDLVKNVRIIPYLFQHVFTKIDSELLLVSR